MKLLDLFCGAGGAAMGYFRAGFEEIVGVDILLQRHYPFEFVQADALQYAANHAHEYDLIHASPPCQPFSKLASLTKLYYPDLIAPTRDILIATGKPYVIENVPNAPLKTSLMLCGTMFGLRVIRHRLFECYPVLVFAPTSCHHRGRASGNRKCNMRKSLENYKYLTIVGNNYIAEDGRRAMGIPWMTRKELSQAIPPAYTEYIGKLMLSMIIPGRDGS